MYKKILSTTLSLFFLCTGCAIVGVIGTPSPSEKKIAAEFDLSAEAEGEILVLVNQPMWGNITSNLRPLLTKDINEMLCEKAKLPAERLISYRRLAEVRSRRSDFYSLEPAEAGAALGAKTVLFVDISDYELYELPASSYYSGLLSVRCGLFDVATGRKLWPTSDGQKEISVGFEAVSGGPDAIAKKLSRTYAHCVVRYFYDCRKDKFKIWGEKPNLKWEDW